MTATAKTPEEQEQQRRAEFVAARNVYILIIVSFVAVCTVAVIITSQMEAKKSGFQAIETQAPISFIDKTYVKKDTSSSEQAE